MKYIVRMGVIFLLQVLVSSCLAYLDKQLVPLFGVIFLFIFVENILIINKKYYFVVRESEDEQKNSRNL